MKAVYTCHNDTLPSRCQSPIQVVGDICKTRYVFDSGTLSPVATPFRDGLNLLLPGLGAKGENTGNDELCPI